MLLLMILVGVVDMKRSLFVVITTGQFYQFIFAANGFVAQYAQSSRTVCTLRFLCAVRLALHPHILY